VKTGLDGSAEAQLRRAMHGFFAEARRAGRQALFLEYSGILSGLAQNIDLTNDNAKVEEISAPASPQRPPAPDLTNFQATEELRSDGKERIGHGTGFFVDNKGLILTNQHVVANSEYCGAV